MHLAGADKAHIFCCLLPTTLIDEVQLVIRTVLWGSAWLFAEKQKSPEAQPETVDPGQLQQVHAFIKEVAGPYSYNEWKKSAQEFVNQLATNHKSIRASLFFLSGSAAHLVTISDVGKIDNTLDVQDALSSVVEEYAEFGAGRPNAANSPLHRQYEADQKTSLALFMFTAGDEVLGIVCLESEQPPDERTRGFLQAATEIVGPFLYFQNAYQQPFWRLMWRRLKGTAAGQGKRSVLSSVVIFLLVGFAIFVTIPFRTYKVTAPLVVEPESKAVITSPYPGYISEVFIKPGDRVAAEELLVALDDRELNIERSEKQAALMKLLREQRTLSAQESPAERSIIQSQIDQASAELALVEDKLERTELRSPMDGVVVSGDLSQSIGAPIERGEELYQVAELGQYKLVLYVPETDFDELALDRPGKAIFSAYPAQEYDVSIQRITPASEEYENENVFRVEAALESPPEWLLPGMEGVSRIEASKRSLLWIWFHGVVDTLRIYLWKWF